MIHGPMQRIARSQDERPRDRARTVWRLVRYLRPHKAAVLGSFGLILLSAVAQAAGPYLIGRAIDHHIIRGDRSGLALTMLALLTVYATSMIAMRYQIYLMSWAGQQVLADLRLKILESIHRLAIEDVEGKNAGDLMSRLVNDVEAINAFLGQGLTQSIGALFALLGIVAAMIALNWQLALAALAIIPTMVLTTDQFARRARRAFRKTRATLGDVSGGLQEELGGVRVAQAFNRGQINISRFAERNAANRDANISANAITSAFAPAMDVLSTIDTAIVAGYGGYLAVQGAVSVGVVVAFLQYVQNFFRPIQTVSQIWTMAQSAFAGAERIFELFDQEADLQEPPGAIRLPALKGRVEFEEVSFRYRSGAEALRRVGFTAEPGETIAIVGPTGAGKSTLVSLIPRFFDVTSGRVCVDGYDVRQVRLESLRAQIGLVLQDPFLFSGTILENIRYGRIAAGMEEVVAASKAAGAHEFISRLPDGYHTPVGERGGLLSQGQRQLIAIARAILADPRILILDEATANVDSHTEALIQAAVERLLKGRTSFLIAHRLSTVRRADRILVLAGGQIVEQGGHRELMARGGLYADLYHRQFIVPERARPR